MVVLFTHQELTVAFKTATLVKKRSLIKRNQKLFAKCKPNNLSNKYIPKLLRVTFNQCY